MCRPINDGSRRDQRSAARRTSNRFGIRTWGTSKNMTAVAIPAFMRPVLVKAPPLARRPTRPVLALTRTPSTTSSEGPRAL